MNYNQEAEQKEAVSNNKKCNQLFLVVVRCNQLNLYH
jgi:hypothetical protein